MQYDCVPEAMVSIWDGMSQNIDMYLQKPRYADSKVFDRIDGSINQFVSLLKALSPMRNAFKNVLQNFIIHNKVNVYKYLLLTILCESQF